MTYLSERDWEALSAYFDNQIDDRNRQLFEARLKSEPELAKGLEELRITYLIVHSAPKFRAPRNFTLTPQMAGKGSHIQSLPSIFPFLRSTAVLATIFFALITGGRLALQFGSPNQLILYSSQSNIARTAPEFGMGGGGGQAEIQTQRTLTTQEVSELSAESQTQLPSAKALPVTPQAEAITSSVEEQSQAFLPPAEPAAAELSQSEIEKVDSSEDQTIQSNAWWQSVKSLLTVLQILLAFVAISTGLGAFYLLRN